MSIDTDIFDMIDYIEDEGAPMNRDVMEVVFGRITEYIKNMESVNEELSVQVAALKAAIVVKVSDVSITAPGGGRNYIHMELKNGQK